MADENPTLVKRISSATLIGGKAEIQRLALTVDNGKSVELYHVYGTAYDTVAGSSQYGPWVALLGSFEARNQQTGEIINATKLFVPDIITNMVAAMLKKNSDVQSVDFAFSISVKRDDSAATGYVYTAQSLLPADASDPLEKMRQKLAALPGYADRIKALPAPGPTKGGKQK